MMKCYTKKYNEDCEEKYKEKGFALPLEISSRKFSTKTTENNKTTK